jgi:hypothetical protein
MSKFEASFVTAQGQYVGQDYDTAEQATKAVEANGHGRVVKVVGEPNLPHCEPTTVWRTCAVWTLAPEKGWQAHDIFNGIGNPSHPATPN